MNSVRSDSDGDIGPTIDQVGRSVPDAGAACARQLEQLPIVQSFRAKLNDVDTGLGKPRDSLEKAGPVG
jgi:hypothetical protein